MPELIELLNLQYLKKMAKNTTRKNKKVQDIDFLHLFSYRSIYDPREHNQIKLVGSVFCPLL
jgi:hypothetical protein